MTKQLIPWSLRGVGPFLNSYGDAIFFRGIRDTPPVRVDPEAATGIHSIVPHRNVYAYLTALKSFLRFFRDVAVFVHDDGTLDGDDRDLIAHHVPGARILDWKETRERFEAAMNDPFLARVRGSYTSYLKLFDPTFVSGRERIILLDTDTLFLRRPDAVIEWARHGGAPWYHVAPRGSMKRNATPVAKPRPEEMHVQTLIMNGLDEINEELGTHYRIEQGFCAGFVGYDAGMVDFDELRALLQALYARFGDRIFRWGAEQTVHGLVLCGKGAHALAMEDYFVFTQKNAHQADRATFVHFVGENRFYRMRYPRFAAALIRDLRASG